MPDARKSHEQKSLADRQRYINTTVKQRIPTPTIEEDPFGDVDSTEAIRRREQPLPPTSRVRREPSALRVYLSEKWPEILIGIIVIAMGIQTFSLNREVGELKAELTETRNQQQQLKQELEKTENRLQNEINRLRDQLDRNSDSKSR